MHNEPFRIFIGWDSRESVAWHVLAHSIMKHASCPVAIMPLDQRALRAAQIYTRERDVKASTEFSITRFLVPYLSNFQGVSVFMDCDMLVQYDITELLAYALSRPDCAVLVCKHDYVPKQTVKFLGQAQEAYPRKNWSSVMVFNNAVCKVLTPELVNAATPKHLHRFEWTKDERIGELPLEWNWLVGEYESRPDARNLHWTNGGPWFPETLHVDCADRWFDALDEVVSPVYVLARDVVRQMRQARQEATV